jgi:hypothetical protein
MAAMPDLTLLMTCGRVLLVGYATAATVLATACLALQLMTKLDRQSAGRRGRRRLGSRLPAAGARPLFVRLDPELDAP